MADNRKVRGFVWSTAANGGKSCPAPIEMAVADAYQGQLDGAGANVDLRPGDPVKLVSTGTVALANTTDAPYGIMVGVSRYFNGTVIDPHAFLPGGATGGGIFERQSRVLVVPANAGTWSLQVDDKTTATTEAAYQAFIGENVIHVCAGDGTTGYAAPQIDISSHATTATLEWRIVGIDPTESNADFAESNVSLLLQVNFSQLPQQAATPVVGT